MASGKIVEELMVSGGGGGRLHHANHHYHHHHPTTIPDWYHVAIKRMIPNRIDTRGGRIDIVSYNDVEKYSNEIKILLRLCQGYNMLEQRWEKDDDNDNHNNNDENETKSNYDVKINSSRLPILFLYEYFWTGREIYMVTEVLEIDLTHWIQQQQPFTEQLARKVARVVLESIDYVHSRKVIHRDIKLQNLIFKNALDYRSLKLIDFGLSKILEGPNDRAYEFCGSPYVQVSNNLLPM
jgi:serine/threonine protein kinase